MSKEIWKDVPEYKGFYQASSLGRIKSISRVIKRSDGVIKNLKETILKQSISDTGYPTVSLYKQSKRKTFATHRIIAICFLNHKPNGFTLVIDHIDDDKTNNKATNLQLVSNRRNIIKTPKGSSKYVGVSFCNTLNTWRSCIYINGKSVYLGVFDNEIDASIAYQSKLKEIESPFKTKL